MPKLDWIIEIIGNGVVCNKCGKVEDSFPEYICNAHTHGMNKYDHLDFQLVLHISDEDIGYILNSLGLRVRSGDSSKLEIWLKVSLKTVPSDWIPSKKPAGKCCVSSFPTAKTVFRKIPTAITHIASSSFPPIYWNEAKEGSADGYGT